MLKTAFSSKFFQSENLACKSIHLVNCHLSFYLLAEWNKTKGEVWCGLTVSLAP